VGRVANLRPIVNRPSGGTLDASTIFEQHTLHFREHGRRANPHSEADWQSAAGWQPAPQRNLADFLTLTYLENDRPLKTDGLSHAWISSTLVS
jgi:hypothetical protein